MPPAREDVVVYLQTHIKEFPVEELRRQLATEGVTDAEFDEALKQAQKAPAKKAPSPRAVMGRLLVFVGFITIALAVVIALKGSGDEPQRASGPASAPGSPAASAYLGKAGWVVKLPAGYAATQNFKGSVAGLETVHFHRAGLDRASLLDEGLYGPLGIVRLDVQDDPFASTLSPVDSVTSAVSAKARERGEKFSTKPVQISSLKGVQFTYDAPRARVETYVVGESSLYTFFAGQEDEIFREILLSLRETSAEN